MGAGVRSTRVRARGRPGIGARGPRRSARITNANWHAAGLEAQLARTRADHLLQFAGLAPSGTDGVGTLAHLSSRRGTLAQGRGRAVITPRLPSTAMDRNPLAGSAHLPTCKQSISLPPRAPPATSRGRSRRPAAGP